MIVTSRISMDLQQRTAAPLIEAVQSDAYSRNIAISLLMGGVEAVIPATFSARATYRKPDGTRGVYDTLPDESAAFSIDGNVLTVALAPQVLTVAGDVDFAVTLLDGESAVSIFPMNIRVAALPGFNGESEDYFGYSGVLPQVSEEDNGKVMTVVNGMWTAAVGASGGAGAGLPAVAGTDSGKILTVVNGVWAAAEAPALEKIEVDEDGFTDVSGLRQMTALALSKDGQTISIVTTMQGGVSATDVITLDSDGKPVSVTSGGVTCAISWEGF